MPHRHIRDHFLPLDPEAFSRRDGGRVLVIAPTRAACETIELALQLDIPTLLGREHGSDIREWSRNGDGFGIVAGTGTGKTLSIRMMAQAIVGAQLRVGVVNREREATPDMPSWNVVIVTTGIARRWFQNDLIGTQDTIVVDEIHQTSAELELCLALGKRVGCRFVWLSATVDPVFYADYLNSTHVLSTSAFDPTKAATVLTHVKKPMAFLDSAFRRKVVHGKRGVAVFLPTRAEVEDLASVLERFWDRVTTVFYHGGEPIRVLRPFLEGTARKPFVLVMTAAGQSALNIQGLDTVVIYDAQYRNVIDRGRNVLTRQYLGANEILQMAGRVHGRVEKGEVHILTDRNLSFSALRPTPPAFQLAGDSERVALTAAAIGVDLEQLELPVPLDRVSYRRAIQRLTERGIVERGRLTDYGRDVEAMPVDRAWGELLVHCSDDLTPFIAVMANIESLHRLTRDEYDLTGLRIEGSDHLTAYNLYAEAVNEHGYLGEVYGLPRHLFHETLDGWADKRGTLVKAIEDIALGTASVYRTLESVLPGALPLANKGVSDAFRELLAQYMPLELVINETTADGENVRVSRTSTCNARNAVAGSVRYFADRYGTTRGAVEGTNLSMALIKRHATQTAPYVDFQAGKRRFALFLVRRQEFFGFELSENRERLSEPFPAEYADAAREQLIAGLIAGVTTHPDQPGVRRLFDRVGELWRRSGGREPLLSPDRFRALLSETIQTVATLEGFLATRLRLDFNALVPSEVCETLESLPSSAKVRGDRAALSYEIENGAPIVRMRLREGQARLLTEAEVPEFDRPLRFDVLRGKRPALRADSFDDLKRLLSSARKALTPVGRKRGHPRRGRRH